MSDRGTGRTTEQIKTAPPGAVFVWGHGYMGYARRLAQSLGRTDLTIVTVDWARDRRFVGLRKPIVVDHAVELPEDISLLIEITNSRAAA